VEPLITKTKKNENEETIMHQHRLVFSYLNDKFAVKELFTVVAGKVASRPGGYTRIIKLGTRPGDNAERALIELVDFNDVYGKSAAKTEEAATKRTRRGSKKAATVATEEKQTPTAPVAEVTPTVEPVEETKVPE